MPTPRACGWRGLARKTNRPLTIHVALEAHCAGSDRPSATDLANLAARAVASPLTPGATFARPVRERAQPAPDRLPSCRSRDVATSSHPRPRIRPRETESSTPVRLDLAVPPHQRVSRLSSKLDRASPAVPTRLATALHDERTSSTRDACDRRLPPIPSESCTHRRSATGCQVPRPRGRRWHPPPRGGGLTGAWRVSRRPTRFGLFSHASDRRAFSSRAPCCASPSDAPVTEPSPPTPRSRASSSSRSPARPRSPSPETPVKELELGRPEASSIGASHRAPSPCEERRGARAIPRLRHRGPSADPSFRVRGLIPFG